MAVPDRRIRDHGIVQSSLRVAGMNLETEAKPPSAPGPVPASLRIPLSRLRQISSNAFWRAPAAETPVRSDDPKGEPSTRIMRKGLRTQAAQLARGSSRRIMAMRFQPACVSVINRRASAEAVIGPAVQNKNAPSPPAGSVFPPTHRGCRGMPERCSPARVRYAAPTPGAPLPAARRSGQTTMRWAAPAGTQGDPSPRRKNKTPGLQGYLTGSLPISSLRAFPRGR